MENIVETIENDYGFSNMFGVGEYPDLSTPDCEVPALGEDRAGDWNPKTIDPSDIEEVIAYSEGEKDEADWLMFGVTKTGVYFHGWAGCDYTGFD